MDLNSLIMLDEDAYSEENITRIYFYKEFNKTKSYYEDNKEVPGVENEFEKLRKENQRYNDVSAKLINEHKEKFLELRAKWVQMFKLRRIAIIVFSIFLLLKVLFFFISVPYFLSKVIASMFYCSFLFLIVAVIMYSFAENKIQSFIMKYRQKVKVTQNEFNNVCKIAYENIDKMYLRSLDPVQRELVLLRRDNQRREEEQRRRDEQRDRQLASLQQQLLKAQSELANEQRRNANVQEELLDIERRKEKKRGGYF